MPEHSPKYLPSYGRRKGRKLSPERKELMRKWARIFISPDATTKLTIETASSTWLEIGFGSGEHLAAQALKNPEIQFIGCETFIDGCGALVKKIVTEKIKNICIWNDDARLLLSTLPADSIAHTFILFPDPWPKKRHNKRRLINRETLEMLARTMKKGMHLRIATDHPGYADWIITQIFSQGSFRWLAESKKDWEIPPPGHFVTRYQQKSLAGNQAFFLEFERA